MQLLLDPEVEERTPIEFPELPNIQNSSNAHSSISNIVSSVFDVHRYIRYRLIHAYVCYVHVFVKIRHRYRTDIADRNHIGGVLFYLLRNCSIYSPNYTIEFYLIGSTSFPLKNKKCFVD